MVNDKYFFCSGSLAFISIENACDGKADCAGGEDEITCVSKLRTTDTYPGDLCTLTLLKIKVPKRLFYCNAILHHNSQ